MYGVAGLAGLFLLANAVMWVAYRGKVLPNYKLGTVDVSSLSFSELDKRFSANSLLPANVTLTAGTAKTAVTPASMGVYADKVASTEALKNSRPLLPLLSFVTHHTVSLALRVDDTGFNNGTKAIEPLFNYAPQPSHIALSGSAFVIVDPSTGQQINASQLKVQLQQGLKSGHSSVTVPSTVLAAPAPTDLKAEQQKLQKQLAAKLTFVYNGKTVAPTVGDIGKWYAASGQTMAPADAQIGTYLDGIAASAANRSDLLLAIKYALGKGQSLNFAVVPKGAITRTYCTATRGVGEAALDEMIGKLAATYADTRGWNAGGKMAFAHVASGCDYTVWLSAANQMGSFGDICDDYYNCQVGNSVVVNNDRWTLATDPWNATGASLEDYRTLIIDHETGHRLGFYDDPVCPVAGGPAPVMMQQSIDLHGCTFNRWPTAPEIATVLARNGL